MPNGTVNPQNDGLIYASIWQNERIEEKDDKISDLLEENAELKVQIARLEKDQNHYGNQNNMAKQCYFLSDLFIGIGVGLLTVDYKGFIYEHIITIAVVMGAAFILLAILFFHFGCQSSKIL
jgi:hypothetical protein